MRQNFLNQFFRDADPANDSVFPWNDKFPYAIPPCEGGGGTLQTVTEAGNATTVGMVTLDSSTTAQDTGTGKTVELSPTGINATGQPLLVSHEGGIPRPAAISVNDNFADNAGNVSMLFDGANSDATVTDSDAIELTQRGIDKTLTDYVNFQRRGRYQYFTDFISPLAAVASDSIGLMSFTGGTNSGSSTIAATELNRPGIGHFFTGTTNVGRSGAITNNTNHPFVIGGGKYWFETDIRTVALSDATDTYTIHAGFFSSTVATQLDGLYFQYDPQSSSTGFPANTGNWFAVKSNNTARTFADTGVPFVANQWFRLAVFVNGSTGVTFSINDVPVLTLNNTNFPATNRPVSFGIQIVKTVGTNQRSILSDYVSMQFIADTER